MAVRIGLVMMLAAPGGARAEHDHGAPERPRDRRPFGATVGLVAARYETMLFGGDYQGVVPAARWTGERFGAGVSLPLYRLVENGRTVYGAGDVAAHAQARLVERGAGRAGVGLAASLPTGDRSSGLGMGHAMVMPGTWASYTAGAVTFGGAAGYGHAIGGAGHDHGAWPLVDPMNRSEVTGGASVAVALAPTLRAGARASGAIPIGGGDGRLIGGVRAMWSAGRVETTFELQAGLAGDPFTFRGVLETALSF